jgi:hypothetical protein
MKADILWGTKEQFSSGTVRLQGRETLVILFRE